MIEHLCVEMSSVNVSLHLFFFNTTKPINLEFPEKSHGTKLNTYLLCPVLILYINRF